MSKSSEPSPGVARVGQSRYRHPVRRTWVLAFAVLVVGLGAGSAAAWVRAARHPFAHGGDFSIRTAADPSFCIQSQGDGSLIISACNSGFTQRFTLTDNPDGTNTIVDHFGECVDRGNGTVGLPLVTAQCTFDASQRFKYRETTGHLTSPGVTTCVADQKAAQGAAMLVARCSNPSVGTVFGFSQ
jgi:hypothetical protein